MLLSLSGFRLQVGLVVQGHCTQALLCYTGINRTVTRRTHTLTLSADCPTDSSHRSDPAVPAARECPSLRAAML